MKDISKERTVRNAEQFKSRERACITFSDYNLLVADMTSQLLERLINAYSVMKEYNEITMRQEYFLNVMKREIKYDR